MNNSFIVEQPPNGGRPLPPEKPIMVTGDQNIKVKPDKKPHADGDYWCIKAGYASRDIKKGEPICLRRMSAINLAKRSLKAFT